MNEPKGKRITIYLPSRAADRLEKLEADYVKRWGRGTKVSTSVLVARSLEKGAEAVLEMSPYYEIVAQLRERVEQAEKLLTAGIRDEDQAALTDLGKKLAALWGELHNLRDKIRDEKPATLSAYPEEFEQCDELHSKVANSLYPRCNTEVDKLIASKRRRARG